MLQAVLPKAAVRQDCQKAGLLASSAPPQVDCAFVFGRVGQGRTALRILKGRLRPPGRGSPKCVQALVAPCCLQEVPPQAPEAWSQVPGARRGALQRFCERHVAGLRSWPPGSTEWSKEATRQMGSLEDTSEFFSAVVFAPRPRGAALCGLFAGLPEPSRQLHSVCLGL